MGNGDGPMQSAHWLSVTLHSIGDAVIATDPDTRITFINPVAEHLTGWTADDAVGQPLGTVFKIVNQDTRQTVESPVEKALREGVIVGLANHTLLIARDGTERPIDDSAAPIRDESGHVAGVVLVFRDISERYHYEQKLRDSLDYATNIIRTLRESFLVLDADLRVVTANACFYQTFHVSPQEIEGVFVYDLGNGQWDIPQLRSLLEDILPNDGAGVTDFEIEHDFPTIGQKIMRLDARRVKKPGNHSELILLAIEDATDRILAERSHAHLAAIVTASEDAIISKNLDGVILSWNKGAEHLFGYSAEEAVGRSVTILIPDDHLDEEPEILQRVRSGESVEHYETVRRQKDGTLLNISLTVSPIRDSEGNVVAASKVARDVSDRKRTEEALCESEERYRTLFNAMDEGYCIIEMIFDDQRKPVDYRFVEVNAAFEKHSGMHDVTGKRMLEFVSEIEKHWLENYGNVALTGEPIRFAGMYKELHRSFEVYAFRVGEPDAHRVAVLFTDITAQIAANERLRTSEQRYRRLFESARDGILILEADTMRIVAANPFMHELLNYSEEQFLGRELWEIGLFQDKSESQTAVRILKQAGYVRYEDLPLETEGGKTQEVEFICNVYQEDGHAVAQCNIRDITERKRLERRIQEQAKELAVASRRKDEFLAMLSHELRNPMAPMFNALQLMGQNGDGNELHREARGVIERQVRHLSRLTDDLLEVSRITTGRVGLHLERMDLNGIVNVAVERLQPNIDRRKQELSVTLADGVVWLEADGTRLEQVIGNLLNNASKYNSPGGRIRLSVESVDHQAIVRVQDNGIGMSAELLPDIFDLFTQADKSLDRAEGGLGIGLALVKSIVELHRGTVEARSEGIGRGSEFIVRLPIASDGQAQEEDGRPKTTTTAATETLRILVVDDNPDAAKMCAMLLRSWGHEVRSAHNGPGALQRASGFQPQVILCDIGLPDMDGYEVARHIRQNPHLEGVLLVAITGYGQDTDRQCSQEAGFDHHMVKPVESSDLKDLLATIHPPKT